MLLVLGDCSGSGVSEDDGCACAGSGAPLSAARCAALVALQVLGPYAADCATARMDLHAAAADAGSLDDGAAGPWVSEDHTQAAAGHDELQAPAAAGAAQGGEGRQQRRSAALLRCSSCMCTA